MVSDVVAAVVAIALGLAPTLAHAQWGRQPMPAFRPASRTSAGALPGLARGNALGRAPIARPQVAHRREAPSTRSGARQTSALFAPGIPRGPGAATLSVRGGRQIYAVRLPNGRVRQYSFARPSRVPLPITVRTPSGSVGARVVAFDLDGTLIDTRESLAGVFRSGFEAVGIPADEEFIAENAHGVPLGDVARSVVERFRPLLEANEPGGRLTEARAAELRTTFEATLRAGYGRIETAGELYPGARQLVDDLRARGVRVIAVTNRSTGSATAVLRRFGLERAFDVVVGRQAGSGTRTVEVRGAVRDGRMLAPKPSPAPLFYALNLLGRSFHPSQAVMIGDTPADVHAANGAGITSVAVTHGYATADTLEAAAPSVMAHDISAIRNALGLGP